MKQAEHKVRPQPHYDEGVAKISEWCRKHGYTAHVTLAGNLELRRKEMGEAKRWRGKLKLQHVSVDEWRHALINIVTYNMETGNKAPEAFTKIFREYLYPHDGMFTPWIARKIRAAASPNFRTLIKAYEARKLP